MKNNVAIIIPTYNPNKAFIELINKLIENKYTNIIVINDGSKNAEIFEKIKNKACILTHSKNQGKGTALKTGFNYCIQNIKNIIGVITVDADGQHKIEDINKIYETLKNKNTIILGTRDFSKEKIPLRSKIGNKIISKMLETKTNIKLKDTQTGLRAIPNKYLQTLTKIQGERFEYEINMLIHCINKNIKIEEVEIDTIYENKNRDSNFKVLRDSINIYRLVKKC